MAFRATLRDVARASTTINVSVEYTDDATPGYSQSHSFNFQDAETLTAAEINTEVDRVGIIYKKVLAREAALKANIGTVRVI